MQNGRWYEPPIPMHGLARAYDMSPHHRSALLYKRNQLLRFFKPSRWLDRRQFGEFVLNFLGMGNGYLERRDNLAGRPMRLRNSPAIHTRRGMTEGQFWWVPGWKQEVEFREGTVFHLLETDLRQEIYGLPEWTSALQSGLLNQEATIFRRKYYLNGSHMGYILYINEATFEDADAEALEEALDKSKGPGNFRNLLLHLPNGKEKGVQVIPVGQEAAKDEFLGIKNTSRDDVLAAHRVPPVLIGVVPQVTGGFGKPGEAADVFHFAEIEPLQLRMLEINDWLGLEAVAFDPYERQAIAGAAEPK
ncbi:MAG: phage portal protein [Novosphingobium sp.]|nr:phage portal protein [Novosphingobium sp.]